MTAATEILAFVGGLVFGAVLERSVRWILALGRAFVELRELRERRRPPPPF